MHKLKKSSDKSMLSNVKTNDAHKPANRFGALLSDESDNESSDEVVVEATSKTAELKSTPVTKERFADLPQTEPQWKSTDRAQKFSYSKGRDQDWESSRKEKKFYEYQQRPIVPKTIDTFDPSQSEDDVRGDKMFLASPWKVWTHRADSLDWTESSYINIFTVDSIGTMWRFLNNFHLLDKHTNQIFIMRNQIKPMWEHNENRCGGICSIKLDCYSRQGKMDIGSEVMICLCLLIMNETLIQNNSEINGISYSIKNKCVLIKLWYKDFKTNITDKLPLSFFNRLDVVIRGASKTTYAGKKTDKMISIQCKPIKPEFEI